MSYGRYGLGYTPSTSAPSSSSSYGTSLTLPSAVYNAYTPTSLSGYVSPRSRSPVLGRRRIKSNQYGGARKTYTPSAATTLRLSSPSTGSEGSRSPRSASPARPSYRSRYGDGAAKKTYGLSAHNRRSTSPPPGYKLAQSKSESSLLEDTAGEKPRNRYGTSAAQQDGSARLGDRSRTSSLTSSTDSLGEKELRKLYEEVKDENERLKVKLKRVEGELEDTKRQLDRAQKNNNMKSSLSDSDKRERRALERKLSEMEEEVKEMKRLQEDNLRLREENGALIRVISKLSK